LNKRILSQAQDPFFIIVNLGEFLCAHAIENASE
jgi:hypothetical protein